jgi:hypothetical protein
MAFEVHASKFDKKKNRLSFSLKFKKLAEMQISLWTWASASGQTGSKSKSI